MPEEITADKQELLAILRENRRNHLAAFRQAQDGYRDTVIRELDQRLADARAGRKINVLFTLPVPEDHTQDYDREIRMLELHQHDRVQIHAHLFDQIVMDNWGWSRAFNTTNATYSR